MTTPKATLNSTTAPKMAMIQRFEASTLLGSARTVGTLRSASSGQVAESDRAAIRELAGAFIPAYLGPSGRTGLDLDEHADWDEVRELLLESYALTAPERLTTLLVQHFSD